MKYRSFHKKILFRLRFLTYSLIFSGTVNVAFFAIFILLSLSQKQTIEMQTSPIYQEENTKEDHPSLQNIFSQMQNYTFRQLAISLFDKEPVELGFKKRDVALALLIAFHDFHFAKALINETLQSRLVKIKIHEEQEKEILFLSGLDDFAYEKIIHFAYREKWPLTAKGLFSLLKKMSLKEDVSLKQTFFLTKEFDLFRNLFHQADDIVADDKILDLLLELRWETIDTFVYEQQKMQDLTLQRKRAFLLACLEEKSQQAAILLLEKDFLYLVNRLDDVQILNLLELLPAQAAKVQLFCKELLKSPRSDAIWKMSAEKLYAAAAEKMPNTLQYQEVVQHFLPQKEKPQNIQPNSSLIHIVQEGENLWKIARKYHVEIEEIIRLNHLTSDRIFPGKKIMIPIKNQGTGSLPPG